RVLAALLAGGYLGALAFAGHGEEGLGFERNFHLAADFLHLLAAGLWLGGLIPLAMLLAYLQRFREEGWVTAACHAASRFSSLRSEEHTSELQSHLKLVCRLLLAQKIEIIETTTRRPNIQRAGNAPVGRERQ